MGLVRQNTTPVVKPGDLVVAGGMLTLLPSVIIFILAGFGLFSGASTLLLLFSAVLVETFIVILCAILEDQLQSVSKFVQLRLVSKMLGWTGHKAK